MSSRDEVRVGMEVYGADERRVGRVTRVHGDGFDAEGQHYSRSTVARVEGNRVYLQGDGMRQGGGQGRRAEGEVTVPVAEERLQVEKRQAELGAVELRKTVTEEQQTVPVELQREQVRVERRDVDDRPVRPGEEAFQESTIRVPVRGEEAAIQKEAVVTGEVVVGKERTTERQQVADTVRKERVEVDEDYQRHRPALQQHFQQRQGQRGGQSAARRWEEAEPNYQYGYSAARDSRYEGREFEDVEPDLRGDYEGRYGSQTTGRDRDAWQQLREEIREGWNRARGS